MLKDVLESEIRKLEDSIKNHKEQKQEAEAVILVCQSKLELFEAAYKKFKQILRKEEMS